MSRVLRDRADMPRIVSGGLGASWWLRVPMEQPYGRQHEWLACRSWPEALAGLADWYRRRAGAA